MTTKFIAFSLMIAICFQCKSQLAASSQNLNVGSISATEAIDLEIPILNQSKEVLRCYSLNSSGHGMQMLPLEIKPYDIAYLSIGSNTSNKSISQRFVFENNEGQTIVLLKGKFKGSSKDPDCYDFSKPTLKVKNNNAYLRSKSRIDLLRIYSERDKNSLYTSNPKNVPSAHLVILIDASGSMGGFRKLEEIKNNLISMVELLRPNDRLSILRYSESSDLVLYETYCSNIDLIKEKIHSIDAGGFTNGMEGITTSFDYLRNHQKTGYSNNLIMLTDGDFNFGSDHEEIKRFLIGQHLSLDYKFSVITLRSEKSNIKLMKELVHSGKGHFFNLDESNNVNYLNRILLKQLSS